MKKIKAVNTGIVIGLKDKVYDIKNSEYLEVDDYIASELHLRFGHLVEIIDSEENIVDETKELKDVLSEPEVEKSDTESTEPIETVETETVESSENVVSDQAQPEVVADVKTEETTEEVVDEKPKRRNRNK